MRKSSLFILYIAVHLVFLGLALTHASFEKKTDMVHFQEEMNMVKRLALTDLCLFTEATYTRHLSQADFHTPFQDSPMAFEHFPSGSLVLPTPLLKKIYKNVD